MKCASGHENPAGQAFCGTCGVPLPKDVDEPPQPPGAPAPPNEPPLDEPQIASSSTGGPPPVGPAFVADPRDGKPYATGAFAGVSPPLGPDQLSNATPEPASGSHRGRRLIAIAFLAVAIAAVVSFVALRDTKSDDDKYLEALTEAKVRSNFPTDAAAVLQAKSTCEEFDQTGDPRGGKAEQVGVEHYCSKWKKDFKLLESATISGTFSIYDDDQYGDDGDSCEGEGGYGDLNSSTQVILTNADGDRLARTDLGPGEFSDSACEFSYEFEATEGEEAYVLAVGDRGETSYDWNELKDGPGLSIGL